MKKTIQISVIATAVLIFQIYLLPMAFAGFLYLDQAESWSNGELGASLLQWRTDYFNLAGPPSRLLHPENELELQVRNWFWMSAPVVILLAYIAFYRSTLKKNTFKDATKYGSHGTARWATPEEPFRKGEITKNPYNELGLEGPGVVLGYQMKDQKGRRKGKYIVVPPDSELNQNVVVYGGSGVGKDFTYMKAQIFQSMYPFNPDNKKRLEKLKQRAIPTEYSLLVVDPKGEAYRDTAVSLEQHGYTVYVFNLNQMEYSHRYNPMDYVTDDVEAIRTANLIVSNGKAGQTGGDPFWSEAEKALMTSMILFVKYEAEDDQKNFPNVLHIPTSFTEEGELDALFDSLPYNHPAKPYYNIFRMAPQETRSGILIGFGTQLQLFANASIAKLTSQSDFDFREMGKQKIALFMIIPDGDTVFSSLTSLFITQAIQEWWKVADANGGTCPVGIRMLLNEAANIGRIPMLAERASVMRSKGVSMQMVFQAKSQIEKLYDKDAPIILQNCDTKVFLGTNDLATAEEMEKTLGESTIEVNSTGEKQGYGLELMRADATLNTQYQGRKLRNAAEIMRNTRSRNIILQNASNPFETLKTPFIEHPLAQGYEKRDPKMVVPPKLKGFSLFSRDQYNVMVGLVPAQSSITADESLESINEQLPTIDVLDSIYGGSDDEDFFADGVSVEIDGRIVNEEIEKSQAIENPTELFERSDAEKGTNELELVMAVGSDNFSSVGEEAFILPSVISPPAEATQEVPMLGANDEVPAFEELASSDPAGLPKWLQTDEEVPEAEKSKEKPRLSKAEASDILEDVWDVIQRMNDENKAEEDQE